MMQFLRCYFGRHNYTIWQPVQPWRVAQQTQLAFLAFRSCARCGHMDQLQVVDAPKTVSSAIMQEALR